MPRPIRDPADAIRPIVPITSERSPERVAPDLGRLPAADEQGPGGDIGERGQTGPATRLLREGEESLRTGETESDRERPQEDRGAEQSIRGAEGGESAEAEGEDTTGGVLAEGDEEEHKHDVYQEHSDEVHQRGLVGAGEDSASDHDGAAVQPGGGAAIHRPVEAEQESYQQYL